MRIITETTQASQQFNWQFLLTLVLIFLVFYVFRRMSRNAQAKQEEARSEWFVVGTSVVTTSGFLGTIVDIDGDAVTLESPSGDESVWVKAAINQPMEIPIAPISEDENLLSEDENLPQQTDSDDASESVSDADAKDTEESTQV